jgi:hypothetical protein
MWLHKCPEAFSLYDNRNKTIEKCLNGYLHFYGPCHQLGNNKNNLTPFCHSIIEFKSKRDLKRAIRKLDGTEMCGKRIRIIDVSS